MNEDMIVQITEDESKQLFEDSKRLLDYLYHDLDFNNPEKFVLGAEDAAKLRALQHNIACHAMWRDDGHIDTGTFYYILRIVTQGIYLVGKLSQEGYVTVDQQPRVDFVRCDDWEALYVNGQKQEEGHSLHYGHVLDKLGIQYQSIEVDRPENFTGDWDDYSVDFTPRIEDIKVELYPDYDWDTAQDLWFSEEDKNVKS